MTAPKATVRVKPLGWEWLYENGLICRANSAVGIYSIHDDEDSAGGRILAYLHITEDGDCTKYAIEVSAACLEVDEMKNICQADYEARILSAIEVEARADVVDELVQALEPFAKSGELFPEDVGTCEFDTCVYAPAAGKEYNLCGDDLRRARAALARYRGGA